eukprot:g3964.t1
MKSRISEALRSSALSPDSNLNTEKLGEKSLVAVEEVEPSKMKSKISGALLSSPLTSAAEKKTEEKPTLTVKSKISGALRSSPLTSAAEKKTEEKPMLTVKMKSKISGALRSSSLTSKSKAAEKKTEEKQLLTMKMKRKISRALGSNALINQLTSSEVEQISKTLIGKSVVKNVDKRFDADGASYTKNRFLHFYGSTKQWNVALPAPSPPSKKILFSYFKEKVKQLTAEGVSIVSKDEIISPDILVKLLGQEIKFDHLNLLVHSLVPDNNTTKSKRKIEGLAKMLSYTTQSTFDSAFTDALMTFLSDVSTVLWKRTETQLESEVGKPDYVHTTIRELQQETIKEYERKVKEALVRHDENLNGIFEIKGIQKMFVSLGIQPTSKMTNVFTRFCTIKDSREFGSADLFFALLNQLEIWSGSKNGFVENARISSKLKLPHYVALQTALTKFYKTKKPNVDSQAAIKTLMSSFQGMGKEAEILKRLKEEYPNSDGTSIDEVKIAIDEILNFKEGDPVFVFVKDKGNDKYLCNGWCVGVSADNTSVSVRYQDVKEGQDNGEKTAIFEKNSENILHDEEHILSKHKVDNVNTSNISARSRLANVYSIAIAKTVQKLASVSAKREEVEKMQGKMHEKAAVQAKNEKKELEQKLKELEAKKKAVDQELSSVEGLSEKEGSGSVAAIDTIEFTSALKKDNTSVETQRAAFMERMEGILKQLKKHSGFFSTDESGIHNTMEKVEAEFNKQTDNSEWRTKYDYLPPLEAKEIMAPIFAFLKKALNPKLRTDEIAKANMIWMHCGSSLPNWSISNPSSVTPLGPDVVALAMEFRAELLWNAQQRDGTIDIEKAFNDLDSNKSGGIDREEMIQRIHQWNDLEQNTLGLQKDEVEDETVIALVDLIDTSVEHNGVISLLEIEKFVKEHPEQFQQQQKEEFKSMLRATDAVVKRKSAVGRKSLIAQKELFKKSAEIHKQERDLRAELSEAEQKITRFDEYEKNKANKENFQNALEEKMKSVRVIHAREIETLKNALRNQHNKFEKEHADLLNQMREYRQKSMKEDLSRRSVLANLKKEYDEVTAKENETFHLELKKLDAKYQNMLDKGRKDMERDHSKQDERASNVQVAELSRIETQQKKAFEKLAEQNSKNLVNARISLEKEYKGRIENAMGDKIDELQNQLKKEKKKIEAEFANRLKAQCESLAMEHSEHNEKLKKTHLDQQELSSKIYNVKKTRLEGDLQMKREKERRLLIEEYVANMAITRSKYLEKIDPLICSVNEFKNALVHLSDHDSNFFKSKEELALQDHIDLQKKKMEVQQSAEALKFRRLVKGLVALLESRDNILQNNGVQIVDDCLTFKEHLIGSVKFTILSRAHAQELLAPALAKAARLLSKPQLETVMGAFDEIIENCGSDHILDEHEIRRQNKFLLSARRKFLLFSKDEDEGSLIHKIAEWTWKSFHPNFKALDSKMMKRLETSLLQQIGTRNGVIVYEDFKKWFLKCTKQIAEERKKKKLGGDETVPAWLLKETDEELEEIAKRKRMEEDYKKVTEKAVAEYKLQLGELTFQRDAAKEEVELSSREFRLKLADRDEKMEKMEDELILVRKDLKNAMDDLVKRKSKTVSDEKLLRDMRSELQKYKKLSNTLKRQLVSAEYTSKSQLMRENEILSQSLEKIQGQQLSVEVDSEGIAHKFMKMRDEYVAAMYRFKEEAKEEKDSALKLLAKKAKEVIARLQLEVLSANEAARQAVIAKEKAKQSVPSFKEIGSLKDLVKRFDDDNDEDGKGMGEEKPNLAEELSILTMETVAKREHDARNHYFDEYRIPPQSSPERPKRLKKLPRPPKSIHMDPYFDQKMKYIEQSNRLTKGKKKKAPFDLANRLPHWAKGESRHFGYGNDDASINPEVLVTKYRREENDRRFPPEILRDRRKLKMRGGKFDASTLYS